MRHEGRSRQHIQKRDRFVDLEKYGLSAEEFRESRVKTERRELPVEEEFAPFC